MLCGSHESMQEGLLLPKPMPGGCNLLFSFSPISRKGSQSMDPGGGSIAGGPAAAALPYV